MIAKRVIGIFITLSFFIPMAFSQDNHVMCEVTENNKSVSVKFGEDIKYLGSDYTKQIGLYDDENHLKFDTAIEVVSYLCLQKYDFFTRNPILIMMGSFLN